MEIIRGIYGKSGIKKFRQYYVTQNVMVSVLDNPDTIRKYIKPTIACHATHKELAPLERELRESKFLNKINKDALIFKKEYKNGKK